MGQVWRLEGMKGVLTDRKAVHRATFVHADVNMLWRLCLDSGIFQAAIDATRGSGLASQRLQPYK
jgi:hypothetical protein